jgi:hypothetical protein
VTERDEREPSGPALDGDVEVPEEDALEQRADAVEQAADGDPADRQSAEADEGDLAEQSRAVDVDDDEYR